MEEQALIALRRRRDRAKAALAQSTDDAKQAAREAVGDGMPEAEVARLLGVDRMTIRDWLGKKR